MKIEYVTLPKVLHEAGWRDRSLVPACIDSPQTFKLQPHRQHPKPLQIRAEFRRFQLFDGPAVLVLVFRTMAPQVTATMKAPGKRAKKAKK